MTTQEYIDRGNLTIIECALKILQGIDVENSSIIDGREFDKVMINLQTWKQQLFEITLKTFEKDKPKKDCSKDESCHYRVDGFCCFDHANFPTPCEYKTV